MYSSTAPVYTKSHTENLFLDPNGGFVKPLLTADNLIVTRFKCGRKDLRLQPNPSWDKIVVCISGKRKLNSLLNGETAYNDSIDPWGICVIPANTEETVHSSSSDALGIYINRSASGQKLQNEYGSSASHHVQPRYNHRDPVIKELATEILLYTESISEDALYMDSIAQFIRMRLNNDQTERQPEKSRVVSTDMPLALRTVVDYIHSEYQTEIRLDYLAVLANVSPYQLSQLFRTYLDTSPHKYLMKIRMDSAGRLLRTTSLSVDEISRETGHNSLQWFSTAFKNQFGVPPSKYRDMV